MRETQDVDGRTAITFYVSLIGVPMPVSKETFKRVAEVFTDPMPFVAEVWSSSTGNYDITTKLKDYQARGDAEVWYIHPYNRTVTIGRRQSDDTYTEALQTTGSIQPIALPNVTITIDTLFD